MRQDGINVYLGKVLNQGVPPADSWWLRCGTHGELGQQARAQQHRMAVPTLKDVRFDPAIAATVSWQVHKHAARLAKKRRGLA